MEPLPWTLLVCLLLTCQVTVLGIRLSGMVGVQQCGVILKNTFPEEMYRVLQSYQMIPSIGNQPEYLEFTTKRGQRFCVSPQKAQLMKEYVDSQSRGITKSIQEMSQAESPALPNAAPTEPVGEEGKTISSLATTPLPTVEGQDCSNGSSTLSFPQSTRLYEEEGIPTRSPSAKPFPGLKEQDHGSGPSTLSFLQSTRLYEEEGTPTRSPSAKPFPGLKEQDHGSGPSTLSFPQSIGAHEEGETPTIGPSVKPFPWLKEQDISTLSFPQSRSTGPHKEEGTPTSYPPTTLYAGPREQMEEWLLQGQPVTHGDVPMGREPTESSGARTTGSSAGSKEGGGWSTTHTSSPGPTRGGGGLRPGEEEVVLRVHPSWGSSHKRHGGSGETGSHKSRFYVFLGLLALVVFLMILAVFAHRNNRSTGALGAAQIRMVHYSRVTSSSDDIV